MTKYYDDYVWKNGIPYGIRPCEEISLLSYKIAADPYNKRISIEQYRNGSFAAVIYDSALFDFRQLKLGEQLAWQKTTISETSTNAVCHIRNQDDRLILVEEYIFEGNRCRKCLTSSPQGIPLSIQEILYKELQDPYNGVVLFDANQHPVMLKEYELDENTGEFSNLLNEQWEKISSQRTAGLPVM